MAESPKITLYTYFRSSCSARLRIALNLKSLAFESVFVNLLKGEQSSDTHRAVNPSGSVPALVVEYPGKPAVTITQSLAALEYLEEITPSSSPSLFPKGGDAQTRAVVRTLANIVACDVQPVTNLKILKKVGELGVAREAWSKEFTENGLRAYETVAANTAGKFSVGDSITMADACLAPAVWNAQRIGVDLTAFPTVSRIMESVEKEEVVQKANYKNQGDTPEELRA